MNQELFPNTALSHYRIVAKLGAGGMGEIYRALCELTGKIQYNFVTDL